MPRQLRIEYAGAIYHVMARGDRREAIYQDEEDCELFLRTLGEACERSGFRVHAYVLMGNHYHLLLETPEPNLSRGMGWLQNAFTRRINVRHRLWGHLFGGRYKALVTEGGNSFWALMDYIHLNPVRAGLVERAQGIESYKWSSLWWYLKPRRSRPEWLETETGYSVVGVDDTAQGRREFLEILESHIDWRRPRRAGNVFCGGEEEGPGLEVGAAVRRGWMFGSEHLREKLLRKVEMVRKAPGRSRSDGYCGRDMIDHGEDVAGKLLKLGIEKVGLMPDELHGLPKGDVRKAMVASLIQKRTGVRLDWICAHLHMGTRAGCCRAIKQVRINHPRRFRKLETAVARILENEGKPSNAIIND